MRSLVLTAIGGVLSVVLVVYLSSKFDLVAVAQAAAGADWIILLAVVPAYGINMCLRAARWSLFLPNAPRFGAALSSLVIGSFANLFFLARAGDLLRAVLYGAMTGVSRITAFATLIVERLLDFATIGAVVLIALALADVPGWIFWPAGLFAGAATAVLAVLAWLQPVRRLLHRLIDHGAQLLPARTASAARAITVKSVAGFQSLRSSRAISYSLIVTAAIWAFELLIVWLVAESMALHMPMAGALLILLAITFASFIPALPAQLGLFEWAVVSGAALSGHEGPKVLAFALLMHGAVLAMNAAGGLIAIWVGPGRAAVRHAMDQARPAAA